MLAVNAISGRSMVISVFNCEKWWLNIFLIAFQLILVMLMNNWYYTNTMVMVMVMVPAKLRMSSAISSGSSIAPKCPPLKMRKISFKGSHKKIRYYLQKKSPNVVNPPTQPIDLRLGTWICRKIPAKSGLLTWYDGQMVKYDTSSLNFLSESLTEASLCIGQGSEIFPRGTHVEPEMCCLHLSFDLVYMICSSKPFQNLFFNISLHFCSDMFFRGTLLLGII